MKISIFTGKDGDTERLRAVKKAAFIAKKQEADILILPGWPLEIRRANRTVFQKLADQTGIYILAEICNTFCFRPGQLPIGPFVQQFSTGANAKHNCVQEVRRGFIEGERTVKSRMNVLVSFSVVRTTSFAMFAGRAI